MRHSYTLYYPADSASRFSRLGMGSRHGQSIAAFGEIVFAPNLLCILSRKIGYEFFDTDNFLNLFDAEYSWKAL